jgi:hypothetical protein
MKNIMIVVFMALASCFAFALANADSDSNTNQQPGTADTTRSDTSAGSGTSQMPGTAQTETKTSRIDSTRKTCTDQSGVTYRKGQKGYKTCIESLEKSHRSEQMGGQTPSSRDEHRTEDTQ